MSVSRRYVSRDEGGSLHGARPRPVQIAKAIAAVVTFAATMTGLIFGLWPTLKPTEPPATKGATLSNPTVDHISFGQYLDREAQPRSSFRSAQLEHRGALVGFDLNVKGYTDEKLPLKWQLFDARTGDQVGRWGDRFYIPRAGDDHNSLSIWVPVAHGRDRRFFVEIQLLDNRGAVPLGRLRTKRFSGT
jgi:hypothetical protein